MKVLEEIKDVLRPRPDEKKELTDTAKDVLNKLNKNLKVGKAIIGGSAKKGTWVHTNHDIDVFVQFPYSYADKSDELSDILHPVLKKLFPKVKRVHGSRDYFQAKQGKFDIEIIPILKVSSPSKAKNITDLSPLHSIWIEKREKNHVDDIRMLKAFCRAQKMYGAESHIKGFSGYGCEVLIIYYGSFLKVLRASQKWKKQQVIDAEKHYKKENPLLALNSSKISPLILIDPIDKDRNVLAALSEKQFNHFKAMAKKFLAKPDPYYFSLDIVTVPSLKKRLGKNSVIMEIVPKKGKEDVSGTKVLKALEHLQRVVEKQGFTIKELDWEWHSTKTYAWVQTKESTLPAERTIQGPPLAHKKHVVAFKKKHKKWTASKSKITAKEKIKIRDLRKLVNKHIKDKYITERMKTIKVVA